MLSYGSAAFIRSVSSDLLSELLQVYDVKDAYCIIAIATLRVARPEITSSRLGTHYRRTFVSKYYPGIAISPNSVCSFYQKLEHANSDVTMDVYKHIADFSGVKEEVEKLEKII